MKRRNFIQNAALVGASAVAAPCILKGKNSINVLRNENILSFEGDSIMIIIELFGGNDGLNTIIPVYNDTYYKLRPKLAYKKEWVRQYQNSDLYFNPGLVDNVHNGGMLRLFEDGRLAIIEGIGYDNPNLSHFRSQDIWHSGINSSDNSVRLEEGWLGRYLSSKLPNFPLEIPEHPLAIQIGGTLSLLLRSQKGDMGIALTDPDEFYQAGKDIVAEFSPRTIGSTFDREFNFALAIAKQAELYSTAVKAAFDQGKTKIKVNYSSGLSQRFKIISSLISGGLKTKIYFVSLSNFDSHAQQVDDGFVGQHPTLLNQLARSISEFMDDAIQQGYADRVVGMTISEFGRRPYENGSRGTDHGAASMQFVFGHDDYVNGAYFREEGKPDLDDLDETGSVRYQYDYRRTFVDFLQTWFGANDDEIEIVFGQKFQPIGVLKPRTTSVEQSLVSEKGYFSIYPNPNYGRANVTFELRKASKVEINIFNLLGYSVKKVYSGWLEQGCYNYDIDINKSGSYFCSLNVNGKMFSTQFRVIR